MRKMMKKSVDRKIFRRTAIKTKALNVPGKITPRGGTRL
nr:hypothetical protein YKEOBPQY_YKEOBPQY_CDS_0003 [Microvirus sp.]